MNFTIFTSATNYSKLQHLKIKAQRKMSGMSDPVKEMAKDNIEKDKIGLNIQKIAGKLKAGLKISVSELDYLRTHSPETYEKAIKVLSERDEYKKKLDKCETKEAVEKVRMNKLQEYATELESIENSNLGEAEKLKQAEFVEMKMMGIISEHASFIMTTRYQQLPQDEKERSERNGNSKVDNDPLNLLNIRSKEKEKVSPKPDNIPYDEIIGTEQNVENDATKEIFHAMTSATSVQRSAPVKVSGSNTAAKLTYSKTASQASVQSPTITKTV